MKENQYNKPHSSSYSNPRVERDYGDSPSNYEIVKKEQEYRHRLQEKYLKINTASFRIGQLFGLIYNLALVYILYVLIRGGDKDLALKIFTLNAALIAFAVGLSTFEKRIFARNFSQKKSGKKFKGRNESRSDKSENRNRDDREKRRDDRDDKRRPRSI
jgi:hypothetical protein